MAKVKVSKFGEAGFRKSVGKHISKDGSLKPKMWYLGDHPKTAARLADFIVNQWKDLKVQGVDHWTDDAIARIEAYRDTGDAEAALHARPTPKVERPTKKVVRTLTTHQVIDQFDQHYKQGGPP